MQNRRVLIAITLIGALLLVVGGVWLAPAYPSSYDEPTTIVDKDAPPEFTDSYTIKSEVSIDGYDHPTFVNQTFIVDDQATAHRAHSRHLGPESNYSIYTNSSKELSASRITRKIDDFGTGDWPEETTVRNETVGDKQIVITAEPGNRSIAEQYAEDVSFPTDEYLGFVDYDQRGQETYAGRTVTVYEPTDGWYEPSNSDLLAREYRILDAEGSVYLEEETNALLYADVSYTIVVASDYREYLYQRLTGEEVLEHELSWEFTDEGGVKEPEWMDELEDSEWADDLE